VGDHVKSPANARAFSFSADCRGPALPGGSVKEKTFQSLHDIRLVKSLLLQEASVFGPPESVSPVHLGDLLVESQEIPQDADAEETGGEEVENPGDYFAHVEAMYAEDAQESEQDPGDVVVRGAGYKAFPRVPRHRWDQEQVDNPADEEQAQGEEPDGAGDLFAIVEAMGPDEAEHPEQVAHQNRMSVVAIVHIWSSRELGCGMASIIWPGSSSVKRMNQLCHACIMTWINATTRQRYMLAVAVRDGG
jgi:hypothetical protein